MTSNDWILVSERLPEQSDVDRQGCVQVWHVFNGVMMMQWHLVAEHGTVTHWKRAPQPPEGYQELRRRYMEGVRA